MKYAKTRNIFLGAAIAGALTSLASAYADDTAKAAVNMEKPSYTTSADKNFIDELKRKGAVKILGSQKLKVAINGKKEPIEALGIKTQTGERVVAYKIGELLVIGGVFDKDGRNLSAMLKDKLIPVEDLGNIVKQADEKAVVIQEGNKDAPLIYVFSEPVCPACKMFSETIQPMINQGKLQVKWILVPFLSKESPQKIQALVDAKNPGDALAKNYKDLHGHSGGIKPAKAVTPEVKKKIDEGLRLMREAGITGTPGIIIKKNGVWQLWDRKNPNDLLNSK